MLVEKLINQVILSRKLGCHFDARKQQLNSCLSTLFAVIVAATSMTAVAPQILQVGKAAGAAHGLFKIIDRTPTIDSLDEAGDRLTTLNGDIEFRNVDFHYPSRPNVPIFDGFNLTIPANKTTALVGPSGSGKSTIVGLLERWYQPLAGEILMDGRRIEDLNIQWLRSNIRMVQQV